MIEAILKNKDGEVVKNFTSIWDMTSYRIKHDLWIVSYKYK